MWNRIRTIWFKELMDSLRDKKALRQAILMPVVLGVFYALLNPLLFAGIERRVEGQQAETVSIVTIGSEHVTDGLTQMLSSGLLSLREWDGTRAELEAQVQEGDVRVALVVPDGFGGIVGGVNSAEIELLVNTGGSAFDIDTSAIRLRSLIEAYSAQLVAGRLAERGIDPALLSPIAITDIRLTTPEQTAGQQAGFLLPILVAVVVVQGGLFVAIDVTAGEKERGTLESLLLTPATDAEIFFGKLLAVFTTTMIPLTLTFLAYGLTTNLLPDSLSNGAQISATVVFGSILVAIPLTIAVNVVLMIIAIRTRTFKDAQTAVTPVMLLTMFPSMAAGFFPAKSAIMALIPAYGTGLVAGKLATEGAIPMAAFGFSIIGCSLVAIIGVVIGLRLFDREHLLYSM